MLSAAAADTFITTAMRNIIVKLNTYHNNNDVNGPQLFYGLLLSSPNTNHSKVTWKKSYKQIWYNEVPQSLMIRCPTYLSSQNPNGHSEPNSCSHKQLHAFLMNTKQNKS